MSTVVAFPPEVERVLAFKAVGDPEVFAMFIAAVRSSGRDDAEFTIERLHELLALGEHFQSLLLYDQVDFLRRSGASESDREFATNVQRVYLEFANGLQRFIRTREAWSTAPESGELVLRLIGLAIDAIHGMMKWGYFLGEPARSAPWRQLHSLYALADVDGTAREPFVLHRAQPAFTPTVQSLYLRTLVLDMLNAGNLSRLQIEIADGWFSSWCLEYALDSEYAPAHHLFCVDFDANGGMRLIRGDVPSGSARYLNADALKKQIEEVREGLRHGRLFAGYGSGAVFPLEEHVALLSTIEKLHESVLSGTESRIEERTHFEDREVDMVSGAERVLRKVHEGPTAGRPNAARPQTPALDVSQTIELSPSGLSLVPSEAPAPAEHDAAAPMESDPEVERWRVQDLSSKGYGLIIDHAAAETIAVNGLLALLNQETGGWIVGTVVRKRPSRVRGEVLVGVEVLAYKAIAVELQATDGGASIPALYLPGGDTSGKQDSLLVGTGQFSSARVYGIRTSEGEFRVRMNRMIRKGADWINARFELESKKS